MFKFMDYTENSHPISMSANKTPTEAELFQRNHKNYFFEDAHFQVEAAASVAAKEIAHNVFEFKDFSVLWIGTHVPVVQVFANRAELGGMGRIARGGPQSRYHPAPGLLKQNS